MVSIAGPTPPITLTNVSITNRGSDISITNRGSDISHLLGPIIDWYWGKLVYIILFRPVC